MRLKLESKNQNKGAAIIRGNWYALELEQAISKFDIKNIQKFLEQGLNPNVDLKEEGYTPLKLACVIFCREDIILKIVELLLKHNAKVDLKSCHSSSTTQTQVQSQTKSKSQTQTQTQAQTWSLPSAWIDNVLPAITPVLVKTYGSGHLNLFDAKDLIQMTPLMLAIGRSYDKKYGCLPKVIKLLLEHKANPNLKFPDGHSILSQHIDKLGDQSITRILLEHKAGPNLVNDDGTTALFLAAKHLYRCHPDEKEEYSTAVDNLNLLLHHGANPFLFTELSSEKLIWDVKRFDLDFVDDIDSSSKINPGGTALLYQASYLCMFASFGEESRSLYEAVISNKYRHSLSWSFWEWMQKTIDDKTTAITSKEKLISIQKSIADKDGLKHIVLAFSVFLLKHPECLGKMKADSVKFNSDIGDAIHTFIRNILSVLKLRGYRVDKPGETNGELLLQWLDSILSEFDNISELHSEFLRSNLLAIRGHIYSMNGRREEAVKDWMKIKEINSIPRNLCVSIGEGLCTKARDKANKVDNYTQLMSKGLAFLKQAGSEVTPELLKLYVIDDESEWKKALEFDTLVKEKHEQKVIAKQDSGTKTPQLSIIREKSTTEVNENREVAMSLDEQGENEDETESKDQKDAVAKDEKEMKAVSKRIAALKPWHHRVDAKLEMLSYGWDPLINAMKEFENYIDKNKPRFQIFISKEYAQNKQVYENLLAIFKDWQVWGLDKEQAIVNLQAMKDAMKSVIDKPQSKSYSLLSIFSPSCVSILDAVDKAIDALISNLSISVQKSSSHQVKEEKETAVVVESKDESGSSASTSSSAAIPVASIVATISM